MSDTPKIIPDFHIIVLHENMEHWNLPKMFKGKPLKANVKGIDGVFTYNSNEVTYCCEMTPSYWLEFLEYRFIFKDDDAAPDDTDTFFHDVTRDDQSKYVHCHVIDDIVEKLKQEPFRYDHIGDPFGDVPEDEIEDGYTRMDAIHELWNTNPPL